MGHMLDRPTVFLCHASQDRQAVRDLALFLDQGAHLELCLEEGEIGPEESLISKVADALQAEVMLVILSPDSAPRWVLEEWRSALRDGPKEARVDVAVVLHRNCQFPQLLRRENFFDLTENRLDGFRALKQWLLRRRAPPQELFFVPDRHPQFTGRCDELEALRGSLGDSPGVAVLASDAPGLGKTTLAVEFAWRCRGDFEGVFWLCCAGRTAAGVAGEFASQLGLQVEGETERNQEELRRLCAERRCLIILDDVKQDAVLRLVPDGKSSVLITTERQDLPHKTIRLGPVSDAEPLARTAGSGLDLLAALAACAPAGAPLSLAAQIAGIDEATALNQVQELLSRSLVAELDANRRRYRIHDLARAAIREAPYRRHAQALCRSISGCTIDDLPDLEQALQWTLSQPDDPEAWALACTLARRAIALTSENGRLAEADELIAAIFPATEKRQDRPMLEYCAGEWRWIFERWDRHEEARRLDTFRTAIGRDQMCFEFLVGRC